MDTPNVPGPAPRTGLATSSLVLGILGILCLGPLTGIPAIITGHMAYHRSRRAPAVHGGGGIALAGLILGYVSFIVGIAMLAIFAGISLPALAKAKSRAQEIRCVNNLKQIGLAVRIYATDHKDQFPSGFLAITTELGSPSVLTCPADRSRHEVKGDWSQVDDQVISYEYLTPGIKEADAIGKVIVRCPIHGSTVLGDGSVQMGARRP